MSTSNSQAKEPIVYVRRKIRKTKRMEAVVGRGRVPGNAKEERRKTEETYSDQLALVDGNIDYMSSQLEFAKDLGETAQRLAHTKVCSLKKPMQFPPLNNGTSDAKRKGKMVHQEHNNTTDFADFYGQRGNKGIEKSVNSRSEEMAKLLGTSNDHSIDLTLLLLTMNQVSPNYFLSNSMKDMNVLPRHYKPRAIVHPSKIISPSRFSQNSDQNIQKTSESAPSNFSFMKLLMEDENSSILADEELLNEKQFLSTQGLSSEGERVQQWPCSQVGNYQFENSLQQMNLQSGQYEVLHQPQQISFMDLLTREDI